MLVSHEVPRTLLNESLNFNDYDYFLIHQITRHPEYRDFFNLSKSLGRRSVLDNSLYELKESFDPDVFADFIRELRPSEYLIPDCFDSYDKNMDMFDDWMIKYSGLPGVKIATVHGGSLRDFEDAYRIFDSTGVKIAFNFAESLYSRLGDPIASRFYVISSLSINPGRKHHLLGCTVPQEFMMYQNMKFIETIDTSNPVMAAFEGKRYPIASKPRLAVDECQDTDISESIKADIYYNVSVFKKYLGR